MGNSCQRCFGIQKNSAKYVRSDLTESGDLSIEFENLMTNDYFDDLNIVSKKNTSAPFTVSSYMKWLSDQEKTFMEDEDDEQKDAEYPLSLSVQKKRDEPYKKSNIKKQFVPNGTQSKTASDYASRTSTPRNWCTFGDESAVQSVNGKVSNDHLTGYFLDELSRDIGVSRDIVEPSNQVFCEEEEVDGPELARLIRRMKPRDLFLSSVNRGIIPSAHSSIFIGNYSNCADRDSSHLSNLYNKIHQNLMKGIREVQSVTNSDRDNQSSIDLDWDHEPGMTQFDGMNPSLALAHKRTDTEEDLVKKLDPERKVFTDDKPGSINLTSKVNGLTQNSKNVTTSYNPPEEPVPCHSPMSPEHMYCTDELVWDMEEVFSVSQPQPGTQKPSQQQPPDPVAYIQENCSSNNSIVPSDKCHLLSS